MKINKIFLAVLALLFIGACSSEVDFGEQYRKIIYIVNSNDMAYLREHKITTEEQEGVVSIYCGGSDVLKDDIKVTIVPAEEAMERYNKRTFTEDNENLHKKLEVLPAEYYSIASYSVTIQAGTEYATLPIMLKTEGLDADGYYAIPLAIGNASGYEVQKNLDTIFYQIKLINDYSGEYNSVIQNVIAPGDTVLVAKGKFLKAMEERVIRTSMYNLDDETSKIDNMESNLMLLTIAADNTVTISPWENAQLRDLGGSKYDPVAHTMTLNYEYENSDGDKLTLIEVLTDVNFIEEE